MKAMPRRARTGACAIILWIGLAIPAQANFTCGGNITYLGLNYTGSVAVAVAGFGMWSICSGNDACISRIANSMSGRESK